MTVHLGYRTTQSPKYVATVEDTTHMTVDALLKAKSAVHVASSTTSPLSADPASTNNDRKTNPRE